MNLSDLMEFEHPIRVHEDGSVTEPSIAILPELVNDQLITHPKDPKWILFTAGYSRQFMYAGPIMHDSEYIGGLLEKDILATPGLHVALVNLIVPDREDEELIFEGWAIAHQPEVT